LTAINSRSIESRADGDVTTGQIGAAVMEALKALDSVAYIRFASVYKDFTQATDFEEFAASIREVGRE
jgi:transcriptional repressor NrdR